MTPAYTGNMMNGNAQDTAGQLAAMICNTTLMLLHQNQHEAARAQIKLVLIQGSFGSMALGMGVALYSLTTENEILRSMLPGNAYFMFQKADIIPVLEFVRDSRLHLLEQMLGDGDDDEDSPAELEEASAANGEDRSEGGATGAGGAICPGCKRDGVFEEGCVYCSYKEPGQTLQ